MRRLLVHIFVASLALAALPPTAFAQTVAQRKQAKQYFEDGRAFFNLGKFREAIGQFERSYLLFKAPEILFMIGQCHNQLGDYRRAIHFYRTFLAEKPDARNKDDVEAMIADLQGKLGTRPAPRPAPVRPAPPPPAPRPAARPAPRPATPRRPAVDAEEPRATPMPPPPRLAPEPTPAPAVAPAATAVAPRGDEPRPVYKKWWFWASIGAAVVTVIAVSAAASSSGSSAPHGSVGTIDCTNPSKGCVILGFRPVWNSRSF